jgi:hypothetical protein
MRHAFADAFCQQPKYRSKADDIPRPTRHTRLKVIGVTAGSGTILNAMTSLGHARQPPQRAARPVRRTRQPFCPHPLGGPRRDVCSSRTPEGRIRGRHPRIPDARGRTLLDIEGALWRNQDSGRQVRRLRPEPDITKRRRKPDPFFRLSRDSRQDILQISITPGRKAPGRTLRSTSWPKLRIS